MKENCQLSTVRLLFWQADAFKRLYVQRELVQRI